MADPLTCLHAARRRGGTRALRILVALCAIVCLLPARALASGTEQSILMDDDQLIYAAPSHTAQVLAQIASLGIDRIKVSVVWSLVAPNANSVKRPAFDATDSRAYPPGAWDRYDLIVRLARQLGVRVYFQLTAPAPAWAVARAKPTQGYPWSQRPNPQQFGQFAQAVGQRYSGSFVTTVPSTEPTPPVLGLPLAMPPSQAPVPGAPDPLPRVDYWGIWNEPNEGAWLNPQYRSGGHGAHIAVAPALYRGLVDSAFAGLSASGHAADTILIGETASGGTMLPTPFVRDLYCVSSTDLPLRGNAASQISCPRSGSAASFVSAHPGLFRSAGYAHHPYSFDQSPAKPMPTPGLVTLATLPGFERTFDRIFAAYGRPRGFPMYLTEFGYKSDPPNPYVHTSLGQQETFLNEGEYLAWRDPRVHALAQFLLVDDKPKAGTKRGSRAYWGTFQSGLEYANGTHKPSYGAFQIPIWLPSARPGQRVTVWGQLRPAAHAAPQYAVLQYARGASRTWSALREIETANSQGFLVAHVGIPARGKVRLAWLNPASGVIDYSRTVSIG
ncbi:MAG: hypothetical protein M3Z06_02435 [Actinomycetota bacterium]|nr:hypothetical protein [Actinomycetota bacterium]